MGHWTHVNLEVITSDKLPEGTKTALTSEDGIRIGFETEQQRRH